VNRVGNFRFPYLGKFGFPLTISAKNLEALCDAISHPEWKSDPRFATVNAREQNWDQLMSLVEGWTSTRSAEAASNRISNYGVGQG
jgi:CoA:oxalate CoA-transferase